MNNKTIPQQTALSNGHKMYRLFASAFLVIFFWINVQAGFAQVSRYPVDANVQLTPPYSVYLTDYVQLATPLIRLNLLLKDQEKFNYQVKLRIRIENIEGLVVRTRPGFVPNPLSLQPNQMLSITGAEMVPYFNLNNLEITGSGSNQVKRSGKLPESIYTFKVEVLDYSRNQQVSNTAQSMAWIIMGQPPLPLNPLEGEKLEVYDVQRVRLTWAPQHQRLPTMGRIAYRVKVVELPNAQTDANNAILSIPPIVNRLTYDTWFDLDYTATTLVPGKHYAWQIIAQDEDGKSRFKNGGKSPVQRFQYGDLCVGPTNLEAEALDSRRLKITWQANTGNTKYSIRYKEDKPDAEWFTTSDVFINSTTLNDLKPNTRYLYQIQGFCNVVPADFSQTYSIRTAEQSQSDFMCGTVPDDWGLDNTDPLQNLQEGDEFFAADFNIKVTKLTATGGRYSGEGLVVIPMMNHMKIKVGYTNIMLNTDYRLIEGQVNVIGGVVQLLDDATRDKIYGIVEDINGVFDQVESGLQDASDIANTISGINETIEDIKNGDDLPDEVQDAIADAEVKLGEAAEALSNGDIDGAMDHVKEAADILAEGLGEAGSQPNTPPPGPDGENTVPLSELEPLLVSFRKHSQQKFGFDPPREDYALVNYPQKEILGENYKMAYKAVSAAEPENILAEFDGGEEEGAYIGYRTSYMTTTKQGEATEEGQSLTVLGVGDGQDDELYAFMKVVNEAGEEEEVETGAMKIASYQPKTKTVKVVPVNGNNYPYSSATLQNKLNEIYGQAVLQWNVELMNNWEISGWDENGDNKLDNGGNGLLANYPKEMRNILKAYKNEVGFVDDAYYIFLVNQPENNSRSAYMPRKKQAGFVFLDQYESEQPLVTTIAHELGHGAFRLEHTFADGTVPQKSTDNLMDYDGGTFLHKYQWDLIHDPVSMLTLLDADEDGAYASSDLLSIDVSNEDLTSIGFMTPSGVGIKLAPSTTKVKFYKYDGSLYEFIDGGVTYSTIMSNTDGFIGYVNKELIIDLGLTKGEVLSDEIKNQLIANRYNLTTAPYGLTIISSVQEFYSFDQMAQCYCNYKWNYEDNGNQIYGNSKFGTIPVNAEKLNCVGSECEELNNGSIAEPGGSIYLYITRVLRNNEIRISETEDEKLKEFAIWFNTQIPASDFIFKYEGSDDFYQSGRTISNHVLQFLYDNEIFTKEKFEEKFHVNTSRDFEIIFTTEDLTANLDENYNVNSVDHITGGLYYYSYADLLARNEYLKSESSFKTFIVKSEAAGVALPISTKDGYDQYVAEFNTDAAFPLLAITAAQWSRDLLAAYFLRSLIAESGVLVLKEMGSGFAQGAIIDYGIQATFNYLFDDNFTSFTQAASPENINWISVGASGLENSIQYENVYAELAIGGLLGCFVNGMTNAEGFNESFNYEACGYGVAGSLLGVGISKGGGFVAKYLKPLGKYTDEQLRVGMAKLGIEGNQADDAIGYIREGNVGHSGTLNDVFDWFDISNLKNATVKTPGIDNRSLTNLPKSFWEEAYKVSPPNDSYTKSLIDDIIENGDNSGSKTENLVEIVMESQDYKIGDGKYFGNNGVNGFDGVYYKGTLDNPTEIIIIESKQMSPAGSVSLNSENFNTGLPNQMSDAWITYVSQKLDDSGKSTLSDMINDNFDLIKKYVSAVDKSTGEINFLKLASY